MSNIQNFDCENPENFEETFKFAEKAADESGKPFIILFSGSKGENGKSWCRDCIDADPIITTQLSKLSKDGYILLDVSVRREDFAAFKATSLGLKCVPTLIKWVHGKAVARLDDHQSKDPELVEALLFA